MRDRSFEPATTCEAIMCCARVLAPSVTPNDPFSRSQRTLESQKSPLAEPLKAKEVARDGMLVYDLEKTMSINS